MQIIEGFHINLVKRGAKKGQEYVNYKKRYVWKVPKKLDGQIDKGDIVWVNAEDNGQKFMAKVLVVNILEKKQLDNSSCFFSKICFLKVNNYKN